MDESRELDIQLASLGLSVNGSLYIRIPTTHIRLLRFIKKAELPEKRTGFDQSVLVGDVAYLSER